MDLGAAAELAGSIYAVGALLWEEDCSALRKIGWLVQLVNGCLFVMRSLIQTKQV